MSRLLSSPTRALLNNSRFIDTTWFMPNTPRNAYQEFKSKRIPKALFLDLDAVASEHPLGLKHMMPSPEVFADTCRQMGLKKDDDVVLYDTHGVFSSPRALWMFRAFGHDNSSILNGGLPAWETAGLPIETSSVIEGRDQSDYPVPKYDPSEVVADYEYILQHTLKSPQSLQEIVLDARPNARFIGLAPESRPSLKSGHMPNSISLPFTVFLTPEKDQVLPPDQLKSALVNAVGEDHAQNIIDGKLGVIASCGSGMTAAVLWLGLKVLGLDKVKLYDESWTGYATRYPDTTILTDS